jgi:hypothetical protein
VGLLGVSSRVLGMGWRAGRGPAAARGGERELVDLVAADGDGLAGEGGQVIEQVAEAAGWLAAGGGLAGGLGVGGA